MGEFSSFLDYFGQQSDLSGVQEWAQAQAQAGQLPPQMADLAQKAPRLFQSMLPTLLGYELDPKNVALKNQQSALAMFGQPEQPQSQPALSQYGGDQMPNAPVPQGLPQMDAAPQGSAVAAYGQQLQGQQTQGLSQKDQALLKIIDPKAFIEYTLKRADPATAANLRKDTALAQSEEQKASLPGKAKVDLETTFQEMAGLYDELDKLGGMVNTDKNPLMNIGRYLANTEGADIKGFSVFPGGQTLGQMFGTQEQTIRDKIKAKIPLISAGIKNATGMSAQQMNSNFELQQYLKALTSLSSSSQAVHPILRDLSSQFGTGEHAKSSATPKVTPEMARAELARRGR